MTGRVSLQGDWKPKQISNPDYKGAWVHPEVDNPEYAPDTNMYRFDDISVLGLDLWQVNVFHWGGWVSWGCGPSHLNEGASASR